MVFVFPGSRSRSTCTPWSVKANSFRRPAMVTGYVPLLVADFTSNSPTRFISKCTLNLHEFQSVHFENCRCWPVSECKLPFISDGSSRHIQSSTLAKMRNTNPEPYIFPHTTFTLFKLSHRFRTFGILFSTALHILHVLAHSVLMLLFRLLSPAHTACSSCNRCRSDIISGDDCTFPLLSHLALSCHDSQHLQCSASDRVLLSPIHLRSPSVAISPFQLSYAFEYFDVSLVFVSL
jgi:hypothetical protein